MKWMTVLAIAALGVAALACSQEAGKTQDAAESAAETAAETAAPATPTGPTLAELEASAGGVLGPSCAGCHGGQKPAAKLALGPDAFVKATVGVGSAQVDTLALVEPGKPDRSYLLVKVTGDPRMKGKRMPIGAEPLGEDQVRAIADWIAAVPVPADERP